MEVDRVKIPDCGILVLKDTPATVKNKRVVPGLLGTCSHIYQNFQNYWGSHHHLITPDVLRSALVEPLRAPLPGKLLVANTLVDATHTCFFCASCESGANQCLA